MKSPERITAVPLLEKTTVSGACQFAEIPRYDPPCFDGSKSPWHPFVPYSNEVSLKMLHINPLTGQVVMLLKAPGGCSLGIHHHYGTVHAYTLSGSWYYEEHKDDWVAKAGDFIYEVANSTHTFQAARGEEVVVFLILEGTIEFIDQQGARIGFENAKTFQQRYIDYCVRNKVPLIDLNSIPRAA